VEKNNRGHAHEVMRP